MFTLRVPKLVEIMNPRLGILLYALRGVCIFLVIYWLIAKHAWESQHPVGHFVHSSISVRAAGEGAPGIQGRPDDAHGPWCSQLGGYEYWKDDEHRFRNISCELPCKAGQKEGCVGFAESFMTTSQGEVFIPTYRRLIRLGHEWHSREAEETFLLSAEALSLEFTYHYSMPRYTWEGEPPQPPSMSADTEVGASTRDITTILVDASGSQHEIPPGEEIRFTVPQLLELAGSKDALDKPHAAAGANQNPDSGGEPPIARLSGLELEVVIECDNRIRRQHTCFLAVRKTPRIWTYMRSVDSYRGEQEVRDYHGLRVFVRGNGFRRTFNVAALITTLTSGWVLLMLPNKVIFFLCITCLGQLSKIYREILIDNFRFQDYLAGMVSRLLVWNQAFVRLEDKVFANGQGGISKERLHERLKAVLLYRGNQLDDAEVRRLVDFCFKAVACYRGRHYSKSLTFMRDMADEVNYRGQAQSPTVDSGFFIDSDRFSVACTSNEHINLDAVVGVFDKDRPVPLLEWVFTPTTFSRFVRATGEQDEEQERKEDELQEEEGQEEQEEQEQAQETTDVVLTRSSQRDADTLSLSAEVPEDVGRWSSEKGPDSLASPYRSVRASRSVERNITSLTLEDQETMERNMVKSFSHFIRQHEAVKEEQRAHARELQAYARELEKSALALQQEGHERREAVKTLRQDMDGRLARDLETAALALRQEARERQAVVEALKQDMHGEHDWLQKDVAARHDQLKKEVDDRHDQLLSALQATDAMLRASIGDCTTRLEEFQKAVGQKHVALEKEAARLQTALVASPEGTQLSRSASRKPAALEDVKLSRGADAPHGSLAERVASLETTLEAKDVELRRLVDRVNGNLEMKVAILETMLEARDTEHHRANDVMHSSLAKRVATLDTAKPPEEGGRAQAQAGQGSAWATGPPRARSSRGDPPLCPAKEGAARAIPPAEQPAWHRLFTGLLSPPKPSEGRPCAGEP